jgi:Xaa-Pro aminopeptidase
MSERLARLREAMAAQGLEALVVSHDHNRRYLSGFTGDAGVLLVTPSVALTITDFRYYEQAERQAPDCPLVKIEDTLIATLGETIAAQKLTRLGFESHVLTVATFEEWRAATPGVEWVATSAVVESLRQTKDAGELATITEAVRITDAAMDHLMGWIRPGMTEQQIAWEAEVFMRSHGAEALAFTTIVGAGPNGAMPHAISSERRVERGESLVVDMGALYQGYCADLTRSFCVGEASAEYRRVWDVVLQAQRAAEAAIRPGIACAEVDAVARGIIYGAGYEGKFGHGLGHSLGLFIHENPRFSRLSKETAQVGMVMTVEPGIYLPGWAGVRIEDLVVVTETGCHILTQTAKLPVLAL